MDYLKHHWIYQARPSPIPWAIHIIIKRKARGRWRIEKAVIYADSLESGKHEYETKPNLSYLGFMALCEYLAGMVSEITDDDRAQFEQEYDNLLNLKG